MLQVLAPLVGPTLKTIVYLLQTTIETVYGVVKYIIDNSNKRPPEQSPRLNTTRRTRSPRPNTTRTRSSPRSPPPPSRGESVKKCPKKYRHYKKHERNGFRRHPCHAEPEHMKMSNDNLKLLPSNNFPEGVMTKKCTPDGDGDICTGKIGGGQRNKRKTKNHNKSRKQNKSRKPRNQNKTIKPRNQNKTRKQNKSRKQKK